MAYPTLLGITAMAMAFGAGATAAKALDKFEETASRASTARDAGRSEEAVKLYRQAVGMRPLWDEGWWYLGAISYEAHRYAESRDAFRRAVAIKHDNAAAWALLGLNEFELGEYDAASEHLLKGLHLGTVPEGEMLDSARYHAALLLNRDGEHELAMAQLVHLSVSGDHSEKIVEAMGMSSLRVAALPAQIPERRREMVMRAGEAVWALNARSGRTADLYRELVSSYPNEPEVHYACGLYLIDLDRDRAAAEFERTIQLMPAHAWARLQLVYIHLDRDHPDLALPLARRAVALDSRTFVTHLALGRVLLKLGQAKESVAELEIAKRMAPDVMPISFALAQAYAKAGRRADAERERSRLKLAEVGDAGKQ
jgi:tetratricopeptide (TPR) repeat protein